MTEDPTYLLLSTRTVRVSRRCRKRAENALARVVGRRMARWITRGRTRQEMVVSVNGGPPQTWRPMESLARLARVQ